MSKKDKKVLKLLIEDINLVDFSQEEIEKKLDELNILKEDISNYMTKLNLVRAKEKQNVMITSRQILETAYEKLKIFKEKNIEKPKEELLALLSSQQLQFYFSKIEDIDDIEALNMIEDSALLEIIEKLDKENA